MLNFVVRFVALRSSARLSSSNNSDTFSGDPATLRQPTTGAGLRFLGAHQRTRGKRKAVEELHRYLTTNRDRMRYQTFRAAGYAIGSGAVESAVSHVVQQRMKRVGMRWRSAGADAMLALRSIYRSTGAWDPFWACRRVA